MLPHLDCRLEKNHRVTGWRRQGDQSVMIAKSLMVAWTEMEESRMQRI